MRRRSEAVRWKPTQTVSGSVGEVPDSCWRAAASVTLEPPLGCYCRRDPVAWNLHNEHAATNTVVEEGGIDVGESVGLAVVATAGQDLHLAGGQTAHDVDVFHLGPGVDRQALRMRRAASHQPVAVLVQRTDLAAFLAGAGGAGLG